MGTVSEPRLPTNPTTPFEQELLRVTQIILRDHAQAINQAATGRLSAWSASASTKPVMPGSIGDTVRNTNTTVLGSVGSQYIIDGWRYGDDNVWHEISHLTDG